MNARSRNVNGGVSACVNIVYCLCVFAKILLLVSEVTRQFFSLCAAFSPPPFHPALKFPANYNCRTFKLGPVQTSLLN